MCILCAFVSPICGCEDAACACAMYHANDSNIFVGYCNMPLKASWDMIILTLRSLAMVGDPVHCSWTAPTTPKHSYLAPSTHPGTPGVRVYVGLTLAAPIAQLNGVCGSAQTINADNEYVTRTKAK